MTPRRARLRKFARWLQAGLALLGAGGLVVLALCFTRVPWKLYRWFSLDDAAPTSAPAVIVVLGGGGIPSESGLVRTWHAARMARQFPAARVVASLPCEGDPNRGEVGRMRDELVLRGVERDRILLEVEGRNTRGQALGVLALLGPGAAETPVLLVTSPDHTKRAKLTFRKAGFRNLAVNAAFAESVKGSVTYTSADVGGREHVLPEVGQMLLLRYHFWSNLSYLGRVVHETTALGYYALKGWV